MAAGLPGLVEHRQLGLRRAQQGVGTSRTEVSEDPRRLPRPLKGGRVRARVGAHCSPSAPCAAVPQASFSTRAAQLVAVADEAHDHRQENTDVGTR